MNEIADNKSYILIVDDTPANIVALEGLLEEIDCHVLKAESGNEALALCLRHPLACIFMDVQMPDMDGFEIARLIHDNKETAHVPIVLISAVQQDEADLVKGYESGAVDYMLKPINPYILRSKVRIFLQMFTQQEQLKQALGELDTMAYFDPLTNLYNRRQFGDILKKNHAIALRYKRKYAMLLIDIDDFKNINDTLGHHVGDNVLETVATRLTENTRSSDYIARIGGDEFAVVMPELSNTEEAGHLAQNLLEKISEPYQFEGHTIATSVSIGVVCFPQGEDGVEELLKKADIAMYRAKSQGKNKFQYFTETLNEEYDNHMQLDTQLRQALEHKELYLCYQAQVELRSGQAIGMEALARWNNPTLGNVPPDQFIPIAEEIGLINKLGLWVIDTACQQYAHWKDQGILPSDDFALSINLSPFQLKEKNFFEQIMGLISKYNIDLKNIVFELTESAFLGEFEKLEGILNELNERGVNFSIDDFGTGYSSLSRLSQLPINALKIDKSFVQKIEVSETDKAIAISTIALSNSLNLKVIAEGVETEEQAQFLINNGCIYAQGYLYSKPLTVDDMSTYLQKQPKIDPTKKADKRRGATRRRGPTDRREENEDDNE